MKPFEICANPEALPLSGIAGHERCGHSGGLTPADEAGRDAKLDEIEADVEDSSSSSLLIMAE